MQSSEQSAIAISKNFYKDMKTFPDLVANADEAFAKAKRHMALHKFAHAAFAFLHATEMIGLQRPAGRSEGAPRRGGNYRGFQKIAEKMAHHCRYSAIMGGTWDDELQRTWERKEAQLKAHQPNLVHTGNMDQGGF